MPTHTRLLLAVCGLAQLACAETVAPETRSRNLEIVVPNLDRQRPGGAPNAISDVSLVDDPGAPGDDPGSSEELPPEFQAAPSIYAAGTEVLFRDGLALGQAHMQYFGNHAQQELKIRLRFNNSQILETSALGEQGDWLPAFRGLWTDAALGVSKSCGHTLDGSTNHSAWHEWPFPLKGLMKWGTSGKASTAPPAYQPACPAQDEDTGGDGSGGGGGGNTTYVCYCRDYYDYTTGQWEHGGIIYCLEA